MLLETGSARLLIDPGVYSAGFADLRDLDAILITHAHFDHYDPKTLPDLLKANPHAELVVDPGTAAEIVKLGLPARTANPGDGFELNGAAISVVGGQHAIIHADVPVPPNVGYLVDHGAFYHPGDSLFVPEQKIDTLGLPTGAPWLKLGEAIDFFRAVAPRVAFPIHEAVLAPGAIQMAYTRFTDLAPVGASVRVPERGTSIELD